MPRSLVCAATRRPFDGTVTEALTNKATGLAILRRLDEARDATAEALTWADKDKGDQALAILMWISYLSGVTPDDDLRRGIAARNQDLGLAQLCVAPAALCGDRSVEERAAELVAGARRRPSADVATPFLLAFAWLAIEQGDHARAADLASKAELYDASTHVGLTHLLARLGGWTEESWDQCRDRAIAGYLSDDHEPLAKQGAAALGVEVERWEHRLLHAGF